MAAATGPFEKKFPKFKSPKGRTLADWAKQLLWQVEPDMEKLAGHNRLRLLKLAGNHGERPHVTEIETSYADLLGMVIDARSEEHTSELQSLMRISYAVFCLKKKKITRNMIRPK